MKSFSEVSTATSNSLQQQDRRQHTQPLGSTTSDGPSITTQPLQPEASNSASIPLRGTIETQPAEHMTKPSALSPSDMHHDWQWQMIPLRESPKAQDELTNLLSQAFASQKTYGDKAMMMEYRDAMFQLVLAAYPFGKIRDAFVAHIRRSPDLPTPSDIVNVIEPPPPTPDWPAFISLRQQARDGKFLSRAERDYITWCEGWAVNKKLSYEEQQHSRAYLAQLESKMLPAPAADETN